MRQNQNSQIVKQIMIKIRLYGKENSNSLSLKEDNLKKTILMLKRNLNLLYNIYKDTGIMINKILK